MSIKAIGGPIAGMRGGKFNNNAWKSSTGGYRMSGSMGGEKFKPAGEAHSLGGTGRKAKAIGGGIRPMQGGKFAPAGRGMNQQLGGGGNKATASGITGATQRSTGGQGTNASRVSYSVGHLTAPNLLQHPSAYNARTIANMNALEREELQLVLQTVTAGDGGINNRGFLNHQRIVRNMASIGSIQKVLKQMNTGLQFSLGNE